jgi:16S rRNA G966 N2-methylase RsmD
MAEITLIEGDAGEVAPQAVDMICTDPPFDMPGSELAKIISKHSARHLLLITTMRQLLEFSAAAPGWRLSFDFVLDGAAPKNSKSTKQPHYTHQTGVYMTAGRAASAFNRRARVRADVAEANGYWPTIIRAPRNRMAQFGQAKNLQAVTDLLASFEGITSVLDPFGGSGTTALACAELFIACTVIEKNAERALELRNTLAFVNGFTSLKEEI